jgi:hypothetical protein
MVRETIPYRCKGWRDDDGEGEMYMEMVGDGGSCRKKV